MASRLKKTHRRRRKLIVKDTTFKRCYRKVRNRNTSNKHARRKTKGRIYKKMRGGYLGLGGPMLHGSLINGYNRMMGQELGPSGYPTEGHFSQ